MLDGFGWLAVIYPRTPGPGKGRVVEVELHPGDTLADVAARLTAKGALAHPNRWVLYAKFRGATGRLRTGTVRVRDSMRPDALLRRVAACGGEGSVRAWVCACVPHTSRWLCARVWWAK